MVDIKDLLKDGEINQEMLDALTVLMAGLGIRTNGTAEQKKRSAEAARFIAAKYAKRVMELNTQQQLFQQAQRQQQPSLQRSLPVYDPNKKK